MDLNAADQGYQTTTESDNGHSLLNWHRGLDGGYRDRHVDSGL